MSFNVVPTTLQKSTLGSLKAGDTVNLERALKADSRFDGHVVQGHCDAVGEVLDTLKGEGSSLTITFPPELAPLIVQHGSIAIDGVSLTVASRGKTSFAVALIPHTLQQTTLGKRKKGDNVNLETDVLGKYALARGGSNG